LSSENFITKSFQSMILFYLLYVILYITIFSLKNLEQLHALLLNSADFRSGLPEVISHLPSLKQLMLERCSLTELPMR